MDKKSYKNQPAIYTYNQKQQIHNDCIYSVLNTVIYHSF